METNKNEETPITNGEEKWDGDLKTLMKEGEVVEDKKTIKSPLFIMFAEYMGYISKFIEIAENWCNGKKPTDCLCKLIEIDAFNIFNEMKKKTTVEEIKNYFNEFYDVILSEYDSELQKLEQKRKIDII